MLVRVCLFAVAVVTTGCAARGTRPHDLGAEAHLVEAARHEAEAAALVAASPDATVAPHGGPCGLPGAVVCWTSRTSPTPRDQRELERHRRLAAEHRAASVALAAAEASSCMDVPPDDRDTSPLEHVADIASVEPLMVPVTMGKYPGERQVGAVVTVRAVPGLTQEWLQRLVDCHLARNAAAGHVVPEMPDCPLVPRGATAVVTSTGAGFAVAIRADDPVAAQEILDRAERLARKR